MEYLIDIVGTCNLSCPSCPVGNFGETDFAATPRKKGFMELELFVSIIEKAQSECAARSEAMSVCLYNWGEPLMHPDIVKFVNLLADKNIPFSISSNLNTEFSLARIVRAGPAHFRISMSGYTNPTYTKGHKGGDVNMVISNMYRLRHYMEKQKKSFPVEVFYHVYRDNCDDDMVKLAELCATLDFQFHPAWAYFSPIEKVIDYASNPARLSAADRETLARLVIPMNEVLAMAQTVHSPECGMRTNQMAINHDGAVALCCGVYDPKNFIAGSFLEVSRDELQRRKFQSELCGTCMSHGIHDAAYWKPSEEWDVAGMKKQVAAGQKVAIRMFTAPHIVHLDPPQPDAEIHVAPQRGVARRILGRLLK